MTFTNDGFTNREKIKAGYAYTFPLFTVPVVFSHPLRRYEGVLAGNLLPDISLYTILQLPRNASS
jgi:hypothetical protein